MLAANLTSPPTGSQETPKGGAGVGLRSRIYELLNGSVIYLEPSRPHRVPQHRCCHVIRAYKITMTFSGSGSLLQLRPGGGGRGGGKVITAGSLRTSRHHCRLQFIKDKFAPLRKFTSTHFLFDGLLVKCSEAPGVPGGPPECSHLQVMHGLLDVPAVVLQGGLTLLQGDPVDRLLHLSDSSSVNSPSVAPPLCSALIPPLISNRVLPERQKYQFCSCTSS